MAEASVNPALFVQHVTSNVKNGVNCDLTRLTLLCAPNAAGKTSVVQSMELALGGFASDVEGRDLVKKGDMLARLGPKTASLKAAVTLSDGRVASWNLKPNKRGGYHDPKDDPETVPLVGTRVVFPVQEVREILRGGADTIRRWLMSRVGAHIQRQDIQERLPEGMSDLYDSLAKQVQAEGTDQNEVDILLGVTVLAEKQARTQAAEIRVAEQTISDMSEGYAEEPTTHDITTAARAAQQAEAELRQAQQALREANMRPDLGVYKLQAERAIQAFQQAEEKALLSSRAVPPLQAGEANLIEFRGRLADVCAFTVKMRTDRCLVCNGGLPAGLDLSAKAVDLQKLNQAGSAALNAKRAAEQDAAAAGQARIRAQAALDEYKKMEQMVQQLGPVPQIDLDQLTSAMTDARDALSRLKDQKQQWTQVRAARDKSRKSGELAGRLKSLAEGCGTVVEELLRQAQKRFEAQVQRHLPAENRFGMVLVEGKKEVCQLGFKRKGGLHTVLSGAEWAKLQLALGCATYKPDANTLAIFMPEERDLDGKTLAEVMVALQHAPGQVILQCTTEPDPADPALISEWSIVRPGVA